MTRFHRQLTAIGAAVACALVVPSTAAALEVTSYVDDDAPDSATPCTITDPCKQIQPAIDDTSPGGTIVVDGGTYVASVNLDGGKSLFAQEFVGDVEGSFVIDGELASAITVSTGQTAGAIDGFTLRSNATAMNLAGPATVTDNIFDSAVENSTGVSVNTTEAGGSTIGPGNLFTDNGIDTETRHGISVAGGSPTITGNTFQALAAAIFDTGGGTISGNTITGTHHSAGPSGSAIFVLGDTPTLVNNFIHSPDGVTTGINFSQLGGSTGGTLRRNRIFDHGVGVAASDTLAPLALHGDVIKGSTLTGLSVNDETPDDPGTGNVSATNVTFSGNAGDFDAINSVVTLDSTILEDAIGAQGTTTCTISFSRGPVIGTPEDLTNCDDFQTTANPAFAVDGYHLLSTSPLIDIGNPAEPVAPNELDVDGDARSLDGDAACPLDRRRDIGADEVAGREPAGCSSGSPVQTIDPRCAELRLKLKKLNRKIKKTDDPDKKKKLKKKRRKVRQQLRDLGCP